MKKILLIAGLWVATWSLSAQAYKDRSLSPRERAEDLLGRLSLEEKTGLMMNHSLPVPSLGIRPFNWWNEALHGVGRNGSATVFPQAIGMAASFDDELLYRVFTAVSDEAREKNRLARQSGHVAQYQGLTFWTPNINIFRDPRWGRGMETYGEDPYLTGRMGVAVVRGLQGMAFDDTKASPELLKAHACAKHYAVHSGPEWNRHRFDAVVSERDLRETYLPAFRDLVTRADVQEVMIAYNRFRGEPCGANAYLVDTILRGEWGYQGLITSDCGAVRDFYGADRHDYSANVLEAVAAAVRAGVDTECGSEYRYIPEAVAAGLLSEADVDRCLLRLLEARFRLGEMDDISPWDGLLDGCVESPQHRALARQMAVESFVLLQNRDGILPLKGGERIALIGPNADDAEMMWGNYNGIPLTSVTLKSALERRNSSLRYFRGCDILDPVDDIDTVLGELADVDVVIFAGGISPRVEGEEMPVQLPGFRGGDREDIELPALQREWIARLHAAGKKVILVHFSGSAVALGPETEHCEAILQVWYPGQEGGTAIADVLYGDEVPSGKLPVTFYASVSDLPDFEDYSMQGRTYRYFAGEPLFPFGYGLSYTHFDYGKARIRDGRLLVPLRNSGKRGAWETVQVYLRPLGADGPIKTLRAFRRVWVPAGERLQVAFPLEEDLFSWWSEPDQRMLPLRGEWEIFYGTDSAHTQCIRYRFDRQ